MPQKPNGELIKSSNIQDHARQVLENLKAIIEAAGYSLEHIIKVNVFVVDISQFGKINEIYGQYFKTHKPARSLISVKALPLGVPVEMEAVAAVGPSNKSSKL